MFEIEHSEQENSSVSMEIELFDVLNLHVSMKIGLIGTREFHFSMIEESMLLKKNHNFCRD